MLARRLLPVNYLTSPVVCTLPCLTVIVPKANQIQLLAVNPLARVSMKNAASCET